jgi:hypothetical protein
MPDRVAVPVATQLTWLEVEAMLQPEGGTLTPPDVHVLLD